MKKIFVALLLTIITVGLYSGFVFADQTISQEAVTAKIEELEDTSSIITKPKDIVHITTKDRVIISGVGKDKDLVTMTTYTKNGSDYTLLDQQTIEIGQLGVFTTELSLKYLGATPKSVVVSDETYVHFRIVRGNQIIEDARLIKYTSDDELKKSLSMLKTGSLLSK